jgi:hypothetical protein
VPLKQVLRSRKTGPVGFIILAYCVDVTDGSRV